MKSLDLMQYACRYATRTGLALCLLLTSACSTSRAADFFSGYKIGGGGGSVAFANGTISLSWSRSAEGVLTVKGQSSFASEKLYLARMRNQTVLEQQAVALDSERRFEISFRDDPVADGLCVEHSCLDI